MYKRYKKIFLITLLFLFWLYKLCHSSDIIQLYVPSAERHYTDSGKASEPSIDVELLEVHYIDVGQGDCTLLSCGGQTMLIDCGDASKGTAIQNYLNKQGVEKIDYLILTHPDADHIGGAPVIITKFDIGKIYMSGYKKDNRTYEKLLDAMEYRYYSWDVPAVGDIINLGSAEITFVGPVLQYDNPNNSSLTVVVRKGCTSFLFSGDAESQAELDMVLSGADLNVDVYKVGHHGSNTSSSADFLAAMAPTYAVISCGVDNSYGHPHANVMKSLRRLSVEVFRTDVQGTVIAVSDGDKIEWNQLPLTFYDDLP